MKFDLQVAKEVFYGSETVLRFTFKTMGAWDNCALLAVLNHRLAMAPVTLRGQSAHFKNNDCFECLSLGTHKTAA